MLDAAQKLFAEQGYEATNIEDIVKLSGASVGSVYHQFGGKKQIFMAVAEESFARHVAASNAAVEAARAAGETDDLQLYLAGARAFLYDTWEQRHVDRNAITRGGPAGFEPLMQARQARLVQGSLKVRIGSPPLPDSTAQAVTSLLRAAAVQLMSVDEAPTAMSVIGYFSDLIRRLAD